MAMFSPRMSPFSLHSLCWKLPVATRWSAHFCAYSLRSLECFKDDTFNKKIDKVNRALWNIATVAPRWFYSVVLSEQFYGENITGIPTKGIDLPQHVGI